jgi:hypothetical protein
MVESSTRKRGCVMIHTIPRRTRLYRQYAAPVEYRQPGYRLTSKVIPVCLNGELVDMQSARKQRQER